ncbi:hypothetical protein AB0L05_01805 [Nonomuraea pusilla]|uniref:hypothetical protein n=1 Tax=Nonomuraea pusilla TaxID=46177 RepID=UPI00331FFEE7
MSDATCGIWTPVSVGVDSGVLTGGTGRFWLGRGCGFCVAGFCCGGCCVCAGGVVLFFGVGVGDAFVRVGLAVTVFVTVVSGASSVGEPNVVVTVTVVSGSQV